MKEKKAIRTKRIIQIAAVCAIVTGAVLFVRSRALALFNPDDAMRYSEFSSTHTIDNSTLFIGTYLIGPLLVVNPLFAVYIMKLCGAKDPHPAFEKAAMEAYEVRLKEFTDPEHQY